MDRLWTRERALGPPQHPLTKPLLIAIDGPVASGKSAAGRLVAKQLGIRFLDTGMMYRVTARAAIDQGIDPKDGGAVGRLAGRLDIRIVSEDDGERWLADRRDVTDGLRDRDVDRGAAAVATVAAVRVAMVDQQRAIAEEGPVVMVGRDIGTVVAPDASVKVYLDASAEVRARRRHDELQQAGRARSYQRVLDEVLGRDAIDMGRTESPLRPAEDATIIDTDDLLLDQVVQSILTIVGPE